MEHTHTTFGITISLEDFSQSQYETYQTKLLEYVGKDNMRAAKAVKNGAVVRGAIEAGFLHGIDGDIGNLKPAVVSWLTSKIHAHVEEITKVPPE